MKRFVHAQSKAFMSSSYFEKAKAKYKPSKLSDCTNTEAPEFRNGVLPVFAQTLYCDEFDDHLAGCSRLVDLRHHKFLGVGGFNMGGSSSISDAQRARIERNRKAAKAVLEHKMAERRRGKKRAAPGSN
jgi:hypothetical protein